MYLARQNNGKIAARVVMRDHPRLQKERKSWKVGRQMARVHLFRPGVNTPNAPVYIAPDRRARALIFSSCDVTTWDAAGQLSGNTQRP